MSKTTIQPVRTGPLFLGLVLVLLTAASGAQAANWNGIEPYRSTRADVVRVLGPAVRDQMSVDGSLHFNVAGVAAVITFVDAKFAAAKRLSENTVGTVKGIVLQHEGASDSPESLKLVGNGDFSREENNGVTVYRNLKEGLAYTFVGGKLRTTYYLPSGDKLPKTQA